MRERQRNVQRIESDTSAATNTEKKSSNVEDSTSVTPSSSSVQATVQNHGSEKTFPQSASRCSNKSISSNEDAGHFSKLGSFGKANEK